MEAVLSELGESSPKKTNSVLSDAKRHFVIAKILPISTMKMMTQFSIM